MLFTGRFAEEEASIANTESLHNASTANLLLATPAVSISQALTVEMRSEGNKLQCKRLIHVHERAPKWLHKFRSRLRIKMYMLCTEKSSAHSHTKNVHITHIFAPQAFSHILARNQFFSCLLFFFT